MAEATAAEGRGRRLVLVRHGQTAWNAEGRAQGHADVGLDDTGRDQAGAMAPVVAETAPDLLLSSDLARARETAAYLDKHSANLDGAGYVFGGTNAVSAKAAAEATAAAQ